MSCLALLMMLMHAQTLADTDAQRIAERPLSDRGPTEITVDLYLLDIDSVSDTEQQFDADIFMEISWHDPRLALPDPQQTGAERLIPLDEIWTPRGAIINDRGLNAQLPEIAIVDVHGNVLHQQRFFGSLAARLSFAEFPFDRQVLPIQLASYHYRPSEVIFSDASALHFNNDIPGAEGWRFSPRAPETGVFNVPGQTDTRPTLTFSLDAERKRTFYLLTMFLPMTLIVFMAWTVTLLPADVIPPRIGIATAAIFSVVAMGFTIRIGLPPISYLTRADIYVVGCTLLVFSRLGFLVFETRFARADDLERATRLATTANRLYIAMFAVVVAVTLIV